ncbi:unnamed protein product [Schistocephalus solidus]|uniref:C2H2-type domain-containing protein n=1 Tax=Schistocephalus solidus TaxID=70667 RepID=A0A183SM16_SCHSO|nr:unnamed protein product [Schistocephalus solidus]
MGLFSHMRIHDSGIRRNADNTDTPCIPSAPAILTITATPTTEFSCPHCARNFNSRIGLIGHLRTHRTGAGEPLVPNSYLWLLEAGFFQAAAPRATVMTGGLNQVRVSGVVSASTPDAYRDEQPVIRITYRIGGQFLNSRRMQATTHVSTGTVYDLHFADDCDGAAT